MTPTHSIALQQHPVSLPLAHVDVLQLRVAYVQLRPMCRVTIVESAT